MNRPTAADRAIGGGAKKRHPMVRLGWTATHLSVAVALLGVFLVASEDVYPSSVQLNVSAVVLKKVWARPLLIPRTLTVRPDDVERGYIDVPDATILSIRNNSEDGFQIGIEFEPALVAEATVSGLRVPVTIGPGGGMVIQPGHYRQETRVELRWRLRLAPGVGAGTYAWPVQMHVQAS